MSKQQIFEEFIAGMDTSDAVRAVEEKARDMAGKTVALFFYTYSSFDCPLDTTNRYCRFWFVAFRKERIRLQQLKKGNWSPPWDLF